MFVQRQGFMREAGPGGDPLDLLDTGTARRLAAGPVASPEAKPVVRPSFVREGGKLIVREDRDVIKDTADPAGERSSACVRDPCAVHV